MPETARGAPLALSVLLAAGLPACSSPTAKNGGPGLSSGAPAAFRFEERSPEAAGPPHGLSLVPERPRQEPFPPLSGLRFFDYGGYGHPFGGRQGFGVLALGAAYPLLESVGGVVEARGFAFEGGGAPPLGAGLNFGLRWRFLAAGPAALFADGHLGFLETDRAVPRGASRFNFTQQAGLGVEWGLTKDLALLAGTRFQHLSNAGIKEHNPGINSLLLYAGLIFTP